jgi:hypothetical protein
MAPKSRPKPARFVFTVGMVLAMTLTILTITADRDLAALSASPILTRWAACGQSFQVPSGFPGGICHKCPRLDTTA